MFKGFDWSELGEKWRIEIPDKLKVTRIEFFQKLDVELTDKDAIFLELIIQFINKHMDFETMKLDVGIKQDMIDFMNAYVESNQNNDENEIVKAIMKSNDNTMYYWFTNNLSYLWN
ncbi:hypothetical protein [Lysinibacillus sp. Bpr_S20]|uniref:hypothetical protein n=1 Tax=Lysinibacillus sp. Bpr_S20 TaxID=2933964 RepID=UPI0020139BAB|nr:hypothetical protein [Lysinibacillus sp. Bpr_S20]MCL1700781.1 hypothetical protein [Lysinibacillus sp. Bpr_S20]